jgi:hypothetical protein
MRRDSKLSLTHAARLKGVKPETVKKYFPSAFKQSHGKLRVTKSDRFVALLQLPDEKGKVVLRNFRGSKERRKAPAFLADFNRYQRGDAHALDKWRDVKLGGVGLLTDPRTIRATEPVMAEFSLYRTFNGGGA